MRRYLLALLLLLGLLAGCVSINKRYSIEVYRPVPEVCFVVLQWQTNWDQLGERNVMTSVNKDKLGVGPIEDVMSLKKHQTAD